MGSYSTTNGRRRRSPERISTLDLAFLPYDFGNQLNCSPRAARRFVKDFQIALGSNDELSLSSA